MSGRSITIYEESHPKKNENHHPTHKEFLNNLKAILPASVKPVIVTDAGFRGPWFTAVLAMGWHFVGRLRNKNLVCLDDTWQLSKSLYQGANGKPKYLGNGVLTKKLKVPTHFVLQASHGTLTGAISFLLRPQKHHILQQLHSALEPSLSNLFLIWLDSDVKRGDD